MKTNAQEFEKSFIGLRMAKVVLCETYTTKLKDDETTHTILKPELTNIEKSVEGATDRVSKIVK